MPRSHLLPVLLCTITAGAAWPATAATGDAPCGPSRFDLWSGHWYYQANDGPVGEMRVKLFNNGVRLSGRYSGRTGGKITGALSDPCNGKSWIGTFQDTEGQNHNAGRFKAVRKGKGKFLGFFVIDGDSTRYRFEGFRKLVDEPDNDPR